MRKMEGPATLALSMCAPIGGFDVVSKAEKALMNERDRLIAKRPRLPVTQVETAHRFIGPQSETDLRGIFKGAGSSSSTGAVSRADATGATPPPGSGW